MSHPPAHGSRRWWRLTPIAYRRFWVGVAGLTLAAAVLSARYDMELGVRLPGKHNTGATLARGALTCWWYLDSSWLTGRTDPGVVGWRVQRHWGSEISLAWRPYHVASRPFPQASEHHGVVLPLWPLMVVSLVVAGYAHGVVVGARRATIGRCRRCGYDLRSLPAGAACPECGEAPGVRGQSPVVVSIDARSDLKSLTKSGS